MRPKRYLHRRVVRFTYLIHCFFGVRKPWWPHRYRDRIERLETLRKHHPDEFLGKIDERVRKSVQDRYGVLSEDEFNRKLGLCQASHDMFNELGCFANREWRTEMRRLNHLCVLQDAFRKLNPYLDSYDDFREPVFRDRARLKEMLRNMEKEPYMYSRRRILMDYAKSAFHYDINYARIWKMDAEYIRKKQSELASRHTDIEMKMLESLLFAPFIHKKTAARSVFEIVFYYIQDEKWLDVDEGKKLVKFGKMFGYYILSDDMEYVLSDPDILKKGKLYKIYPADVRSFVRTFLESESFW